MTGDLNAVNGNYSAYTRYFHGTRMTPMGRILADLLSGEWMNKHRLSVFISPIRVIRVLFLKAEYLQ
jgi:hypothetical protein